MIEADRQHLQSIQDRFYGDADLHSHLAFSVDSVYARDLTDHLRNAISLSQTDILLEIGAGAGRFSSHLIQHCSRLVALDASRALLDALGGARTGAASRIERAHIDVFDLESWRGQRTFDAVCGFFILHHLPNHDQLFELIHAALRPGGRVAFVEPNRINPAFLLQVAFSPEMQWKAEKGAFTFSSRATIRSLRRAGFPQVRCTRFGFSPPQLLERFPQLLPVQRGLEKIPGLRRLLPFSLLVAERG
jgi:SAM-dependent methyltransferase